ncbi:MAG TPA: type II toxin-antitoxin system RelE/ParE family toxin [Castellaniella sp.]|uniref:type II toxin-antitoxin system RelE/ParE family toxin n=1 Tax=Castellaniella sp. TaxID=1955812 RepID=UPI002F1BF633
MTVLRRIEATDNYRSNLRQLEDFCRRNGTLVQHRDMLAGIKMTVAPNLRRFPALGRFFLQREPYSIEALNGLDRLMAQLALHPKGTEIREYVLAEHVILYATTANTVYLLAIKHHKQLSFDFLSFWTP